MDNTPFDRVFGQNGFNIPELSREACDALLYADIISNELHIFSLCKSGRVATAQSYDARRTLVEMGVVIDYANLMYAISCKKNVRLENLLYALSIPGLLEYSVCKKVADHFITLGAVLGASVNEWVAFGVSCSDAEQICLKLESLSWDIDSLMDNGVKVMDTLPLDTIEYPLKGFVFSVIGIQTALDLQTVEVLTGLGASVNQEHITGKENAILVINETNVPDGTKEKIDETKLIKMDQYYKIVTDPLRYALRIAAKNK